MDNAENAEFIKSNDAADIATKKIISSFMKDVNKAIRSAAKTGDFSTDIDNYGASNKTVIQTKSLADSIEVLLKCAGYKTNVVFDDDFGCYRFYIDWMPEPTAMPVFPTNEEVEEARKRFAVAQHDANAIRPVGKQLDPFQGYDRERFVSELKETNFLLSGWMDEEQRLRNKIESLECKQGWHKIRLYKKDEVIAKLTNGTLVIGKLVDNDKFLVEKVILDNITCHHMVQNVETDDIAMWRSAMLPPEKSV